MDHQEEVGTQVQLVPWVQLGLLVNLQIEEIQDRPVHPVSLVVVVLQVREDQ